MNLEEKKKFLINCAYFAVWAALLYMLFRVAAVYLFPFLIGVIIAYLVQKPAKFISVRIKFKKQICAAVLSVVFYVVIVGILTFLGWLLYNQINALIKFFSSKSGITFQIENFLSFIENLFKTLDGELQYTLKKVTDETVSGFISKASVFLSGLVTSFVKKLPTLLISCVVTVVATCYISKDFERLKNFVKGFVSDSLYKKVIEIKNVFTDCFLKFAVGYFWLFLITLSELIIGLMLLKVRHFVIVALLIAMVDLLPVFGAGTVLLPWAVIAFIQNNYKLGIGLTVLYILIVVIKNFAEPKIIGKQIGINPLFTLLFIFLGLRTGGIMGMIALPILLTVVFTYYRRQVLNESEIN